MPQWNPPPKANQQWYAAPESVGSDAATKEDLVRERMAAEKRERKQLVADIKEISAQVYAILESRDWSQAYLDVHLSGHRIRGIIPWVALKERAILHFMHRRARGSHHPGVTEYRMASDGTVYEHFFRDDNQIRIANWPKAVISHKDNASLERVKTDLEEFIRSPRRHP